MSEERDEFDGQGGSYVRDPKTGERRRLERPTQDHPDGNRPRDKDGKPLDAPESPMPAPAAPAATDSAPKRGRGSPIASAAGD